VNVKLALPIGAAITAVTYWQGYLTNGGTVQAWLQNNAANAALEAQVG
jgi:hypothetical protein